MLSICIYALKIGFQMLEVGNNCLFLPIGKFGCIGTLLSLRIVKSQSSKWSLV